jgi:hypothetical protein
MRKMILSLIHPAVSHVPLFVQQTVSDRVIAADGSVLPGFTLHVKGSQTITQTDIAIKFSFLEKL